MAIEPVPPLPGVASSNALAGLTAPGAISRALTPDLSSALQTLSPDPSSEVSLSRFALALLDQQADNPTLDIDTAVSNTLSNLLLAGSTAGETLYTATGELQSFAGASLLTQTRADATNNANAIAQTLQAFVDAAQPIILNSTLPAGATAPASTGATSTQATAAGGTASDTSVDSTAGTANAARTANPQQADSPVLTLAAAQAEAQRLQDIADSARQTFLANQLASIDTQAANGTTQGATSPGLVAASAATTLTDTTSTLDLAAATAATVLPATPDAIADETDPTDPDIQADNAALTATTTAAAPTNATPANVPLATAAATVLPTTSDVLDQYQQAALASGMTVLGKELNAFVPSAPEAVFPAEVRAISAVRPVVPRREDPSQASINAYA